MSKKIIGIIPVFNLDVEKDVYEFQFGKLFKTLRGHTIQDAPTLPSDFIFSLDNSEITTTTSLVIYYKFDESKFDTCIDNIKLWIHGLLIYIKLKVFNLWFINKNDVDIDFGYFNIINDNASQEIKMGFRNRLFFSKSLNTNLFLDKERLDMWEEFTLTKMHDKLNLPVHVELDNFKEISYFDWGSHSINYNNFTKIQRAYEFIIKAVEERLLPLKISFYIGALECLFSNDSQEATYKVSTRVAYFLKDILPNKLETYKTVTKIYSIRSAYVHGNTLKNTNSELENYVNKIDEILRNIFIKIIKSDDLQKEFNETKTDELNYFFSKIVFE